MVKPEDITEDEILNELKKIKAPEIKNLGKCLACGGKTRHPMMKYCIECRRGPKGLQSNWNKTIRENELLGKSYWKIVGRCLICGDKLPNNHAKYCSYCRTGSKQNRKIYSKTYLLKKMKDDPNYYNKLYAKNKEKIKGYQKKTTTLKAAYKYLTKLFSDSE